MIFSKIAFCWVEKIDSPIGDENYRDVFFDTQVVSRENRFPDRGREPAISGMLPTGMHTVEKIDSPIGDENIIWIYYIETGYNGRENRFPDRGREHRCENLNYYCFCRENRFPDRGREPCSYLLLSI